MYLALYRKYRPKGLNELYGQDVIVQTLTNAVKKGKISHAYLFNGPKGTGKTSTAKIFAELINCENSKSGLKCNKCDYCQQIVNNDMDIIEIDAASNNGVDEIRELRSNTNLMPSLGKYKVYIIDEVHMLSTGAFNALLKTLEEPPAHIIFILATTDPQKLPLTIISRCQRHDFKKISDNDIAKRISEVVKLEKLDIENAAILKIAEYSNGSLRDALSLLDQLAATCAKVTLDSINICLGLTDDDFLWETLIDFDSSDSEKILKRLNIIKDSGKNYEDLVVSLIKYTQKKLLDNPNDENLYKEILAWDELLMNMKNSSLRNIIFDAFVIRKYGGKSVVTSKPKKQVEEATDIVEEQVEEISKEAEVTSNLENILSKRINNVLVKAEMGVLTKAARNYEAAKQSFIENNIPVLIDGTVAIASNEGLIISFEYSSQVNLTLSDIINIEDKLKSIMRKNYYIIPVTEEKLDNIKKKYIAHAKGKEKLEYIKDQTELEIPLPDDDSMLTNLFDDIIEKEEE